MSDQTIHALQTAIQVENTGLLTYLKFARQTKDEFGKNMFIQLAIDEFEHRKILEQQLEKSIAGQTWQQAEIPLAELEKLIPTVKNKTLRTKGVSGLQDLDALSTALDLERKAADFFETKARQAQAPAAAALFRRLAEWENAHYEIIQAEIDAIQQTGFWFSTPEFRMDGKF